MRKVVRKLYFAWQIEQEREFLQNMAKEGWFLDKVRFGRYEFYSDEARDVVYDMDFQIVNKKTIDQYLELTEGWELADYYGAWFYFYKDKADGAPFSLYSDNKSKRKMFHRLIGFLLITAVPLYLNLLVIFPSLEPYELQPFTFYYFFRIITFVFLVLHLFAVLRIGYSYHKYSSHISE